MKRSFVILLTLVTVALTGCVTSGVRTGPASAYGVEAFKPEQLAADLESFDVWLCIDRARQTAILFLPKDSSWQIAVREGGWRQVDQPEVVNDAIMWMRTYYQIGRYAEGVGIVGDNDQREFVGYLFAPTRPQMWQSEEDGKTLTLRRLTWDQVVRAGKVPGVPYPDSL
ncbi:hypothetical protein [Oleidesulfovibrio sp.]|uniref:hypothetical protein n=1 Tax=Oleidesulfovibrio sp. TaxID=2909707 RepID=UPI003A86BA8C